ncbi:helicase domino [Biomphalaria pfeifferi]|uniref:Helicase domino n=1 Tax=Biomphalaria pfeifferi TaxID=112525 RepID=A0AAD8BI57_BIOPF|nr:helicase domino [Biomphalaria pfeifferi]
MQESDLGQSERGSQKKNSNEAQQNALSTTALSAGRIPTTFGSQPNTVAVYPQSNMNLPTVTFTLPRTINAQQSVTPSLQLSTASLSNTRLVTPQTLNIIQRQLSSGIVGLSTVSAQGLQVLQASGTPLTFVTATSSESAVALEQQRKALLLQQQKQNQAGFTTNSSGTIHHLASSSPANPLSNSNHNTAVSMSSIQQSPSGRGLNQSQTEPGTLLSSSSLTSSNTMSDDHKSFNLSQQASSVTASVTSLGPPAKKIKLEEKPAPDKETEICRLSVCNYKRQMMYDIQVRYKEYLTELFYLQGGGNITEFHVWKKRPTQPLLSFLKDSKLDSDDDEELLEKRINDEVKVLTSAGSNVPLATPVAISMTLPPSVSALSQQAVNSSTTPLTSTSLPIVTSSELQQHLTKTIDVKPNLHALKSQISTGQSSTAKSFKTTSSSPGRSRQQSISSVYENVTGGSQDVIVERAKQEAHVLQRVNELRKEGLWSAKRLPRVQEPPRQKAHWDYLLEEMTWLAADFIQERKWKKAASKKLARMVANHFREQEQKEMRAEKEEGLKLKKIASHLAKMVKEFWTNIEKVVQYKQTQRLEEKKKKALDLHLSFIVDQTEKYSSWLTAGLQKTDGSRTSSDGEFSLDSGDEFHPIGTASDDEETIEREENESGIDEDATKKEVEELQKESELPLEDLLKTLPKEMLDEPSSHLPFDDDESDETSSKDSELAQEKDVDFTVGEEEEDIEETIEEQEAQEKKNYSEELDDLKTEGEMSVEDLLKKYAGAYDDDFKMPDESSGEDNDDEEMSESEKESESSEEEEEESDPEDIQPNQETCELKQDDVGLEFLVKKDNLQHEPTNLEGPDKEFNDIAAAAQSLQPKGYTLETTEVKTKVPFLLKHSLREYQHVGLDWLATMHDKRLNGILADEMGLGKTIQTIAMLAHLACDKGVWGPHLIVVPTSVMLNWEMEFKKWCPAFKILTYYGSIKERKLKRQGWTKTNAFHVCITSYKLVVQDHQAFRRKKWKYFILDEAQNIKNFKSQRWQMLLNFSSQRRLLLTGTPLQNSLMELWSLMHFLMPNVFQSHSEFKEWFSNPLTGMIEGSQEYNESLVRRLHKVLRPFLLRRLKNEVEKQMPQKFEHVVMCRLSKRQRYLYDDFMSQTKTKETLASGHFMSVINILMQLRKVCNHPDLFDPRPIVSPFKMEGIVYTTASLAVRALEYDPFRDIDLYILFPNLAEMELDLPSFVAQRVKQLKASGKLIEEANKVTPVPPVTPPSKPEVSTVTLSATQSTPSTVNSLKLLLPPSSSLSTQQTILIPNPNGSGPPLILPLSSISSSLSTSAAIAQAKLISSQLQSGILQLVQTPSGHQILKTNTTSVSTPISTVALAPSPVSSSSTTNISLLKLSPAVSQQKPIMKVSPFVSSGTTDVASSPAVNSAMSKRPPPQKPMKKSELFLESLYRKKEERRQHALSLIARINHTRCDKCPVYGSDTHHCVNCLRSLNCSNCSSLPSQLKSFSKNNSWRGDGYVNCLYAQNHSINHNHPDVFWRETSHLQQIIHSPDKWLDELKDVLSRFVFVTPTVISPAVKLRVYNPDPSSVSQQWMETTLRPEIVKKSSILHPIQSRTLVTFPELRLIQYDCGKLQTLDLLLRQLKSGQHRVLIFTQMTKMLDVLESFLNFHGHRYLRLDGTTKVEQRQYLMDRFNADPRIFCFILSTRSGGIGVNLTGADTVIFYDSDWNPTMDAQAQDRCHRIGQTRDVHIYRLVSEMTVEENILKKANQKRLLGDLAIEGGNFTTAFFKEQTITDLFAEPSGLDSLVEEKAREKEAKQKDREAKELAAKLERENEEREKREREETKKEAAILSQFEQALCKAEDETDALAATQLQAEQKAELAEFDENIPWDEREAEIRKEEEEVSKVEIELAMIDKELTPIERYAVSVMEAQLEPETAEELKIAEEDIENSKKDWELARLKALKEEEERRAELEEDEMLYVYAKDESQVKKGRKPLKLKANLCKPKSSSMSSGSDLDEKSSKERRPSNNSSPDRKVGLSKLCLGKAVKKALQISGSQKPNSVGAKRGRKKVITGDKTPNSVAKKLDINGQPKRRGRPRKIVPTEPNEQSTDLKIISKKIVSLQNGHNVSTNKESSKIATQARNALLKQQALQAAHITLPSSSTSLPLSPDLHTSKPVVTNMGSPPARLPVKANTPKSPQDTNIPPPWSNPNLVIRTRKAAVHSPVVISSANVQSVTQQSITISTYHTTSITSVVNTTSPSKVLTTNSPSTVLTANPIAASVNAKQIQLTPDRNIFQLFTANTPRGPVTFTPTIRQMGPIVTGAAQAVNQQQPRAATLFNSVSLVNTGARFLSGVAGQPSVVVSAAPKPITAGVSSNVSNITLVPTVINASGGQTIIPASRAALVNTASGARAVLNTARLGSPITLQSLSTLPYAVNIIKTNTGLTLPVRSQQILHTSLAQVGGQSGYVLITPRARAQAPQTVPISIVQNVPGQSLQPARVHVLAQVASGGAVLQPVQKSVQAQPQKSIQPTPQANVNGVSGVTPITKEGT